MTSPNIVLKSNSKQLNLTLWWLKEAHQSTICSLYHAHYSTMKHKPSTNLIMSQAIVDGSCTHATCVATARGILRHFLVAVHFKLPRAFQYREMAPDMHDENSRSPFPERYHSRRMSRLVAVEYLYLFLQGNTSNIFVLFLTGLILD
jgi:hypothetical protein